LALPGVRLEVPLLRRCGTVIWRGIVTDGLGWWRKSNRLPAGWYQGTLNLQPVDEPCDMIAHTPVPELADIDWVEMAPAHIDDTPVVAIFIRHSGGLEVAATVHLRDTYNLTNGDTVTIHFDDELLK
jgi:hypothetical protein